MKTLCTARKSDGTPCRKSPLRGATVCRSHGGAAPQVKAKAAQRHAEQKATEELHRLAAVAGPAAPITDPLTALAELAGEAVRWKNIVAGYVAELERLRYSTETGEQVRGEIVLFERALDRCTQTLTAIARLNIDDRLVKVEEAQAELVLAAIDAALVAAEVEPARRAQAKQAAAHHLRSVG